MSEIAVGVRKATQQDAYVPRKAKVNIMAKGRHPFRQRRIKYTAVKASMALLIKAATIRYGLTASTLMGPDRSRVYSHKRQNVYFLARAILKLPWLGIARAAGKDHSTCMHGYRAVKSRLKTNDSLKAEVASIIDIYNRLHSLPR